MARYCPECHKGIYTSLNRITQVIVERMRDHDTPPLRPYKCPSHPYWYHITSTPRRT